MELTWPEAVVWVAVILVLGPIVVPIAVTLLIAALMAVVAAVLVPVIWVADRVSWWWRKSRLHKLRKARERMTR